MDITQYHAHDIQLLLDYVKLDCQIICGTKIYSLGLVFKLKQFFLREKNIPVKFCTKVIGNFNICSFQFWQDIIQNTDVFRMKNTSIWLTFSMCKLWFPELFDLLLFFFTFFFYFFITLLHLLLAFGKNTGRNWCDVCTCIYEVQSN